MNPRFARVFAAFDNARQALFNVLEALEPIADGTPGLPEQLDRLKVQIDAHDKAMQSFKRALAMVGRR